MFHTFKAVVASVSILLAMPVVAEVQPSFNQLQVASQVFLGNPRDASFEALAAAILASPNSAELFDLISGNQHTTDPFVTALLNRQFVRRLFDPIRQEVTVMPCCRCIDPCNDGYDVWFEGSWDRAFLENDRHGFGFNSNGYELTLGIQKKFCDVATVGIAASYAYDYLHYNLGGHGKMDTALLGLYGLYRPQCWYVLADIAGSYTENKIHRHFTVLDVDFNTRCSAPLFNLIAYAEAGVDIPACFVLVQPFFGIETITYWRDRTKEHGADRFGLIVYERSETSATTRLGLHVSTFEYQTFSVSIDGAWNCRLTKIDNIHWNSFTGFGNFYAGHPVCLGRNSAEGAVTLTSRLDDNWRVYAQAAGEIWNHASDYSLLLGVQASW